MALIPTLTVKQTYQELESFLQDLNYDHGQGNAAIAVDGILYAAFCTDPDGSWILETGDPRERAEYPEGEDEAIYTPLQLDHIKNCAGYVVMHMAEDS